MKHPGIKMIRLIEAICIIRTVIVGSALSVYSADDLVGDDVPTSEADTDYVMKNRNKCSRRLFNFLGSFYPS